MQFRSLIFIAKKKKKKKKNLRHREISLLSRTSSSVGLYQNSKQVCMMTYLEKALFSGRGK